MDKSVVRNWIMVATGLVMASLTVAIVDVQTRQARYQCENLAFQLHARRAHDAEIAAVANQTGVFQYKQYQAGMAAAERDWWEGIQLCRAANTPVMGP